MKHIEQTTIVSSSKIKLFLIIILCIAMCLIVIISMFIFINRQSLSQTITSSKYLYLDKYEKLFLRQIWKKR
jgi:hypothetical protein